MRVMWNSLSYLFNFWLRWVFAAMLGFPSVAMSRGYLSCGAQASPYGGSSRCRAQAQAARALGFNRSGFQALEHKLSGCGGWVQPPHDMWNPPRPEMATVSLILAGRLLTTEPPGKP